jgi:hypothetical protein
MRLIDLTVFAALGLGIAAVIPAGAQQPPPQAPPKAYKPVTVSAAAPMSDAALDALRKQLGDVTTKKDKTALAALVVAKGFFWDRADGKKADAKKSGADNLGAALGLPDDSGWETLGAYAAEPTAAPSDTHKGAVCAPAPPKVDRTAVEQLAKATGTDPFEWGFINQAGTEVHAKADAKSPVVEKVGMILVRIYEDPNAAGDHGGEFTRIVAPSGKVGFVSSEAVKALQGDQLCFTKDGNAWKIAGYIGGGGGD